MSGSPPVFVTARYRLLRCPSWPRLGGGHRGSVIHDRDCARRAAATDKLTSLARESSAGPCARHTLISENERLRLRGNTDADADADVLIDVQHNEIIFAEGHEKTRLQSLVRT